MARQGRDKQRYADTGERLVAGCIPFHRAALAREDGVDGTSDEAGGDGRGLADDPGGAGLSGGAARVRVMLITSRGGKGWVFPKGGWETDEEAGDAAKRETVEEAGARGTLSDVEVGVFKFHSGKQERRCQADRGRCIAHMFALEVQEVSARAGRAPPARDGRGHSDAQSAGVVRRCWSRGRRARSADGYGAAPRTPTTSSGTRG